jgi:hypothetical protein
MSALLWAARHDAFVCVKLVLERLPVDGEHNTHEWASELVLGFVGLLDSEKVHPLGPLRPKPLRHGAPTPRYFVVRLRSPLCPSQFVVPSCSVVPKRCSARYRCRRAGALCGQVWFGRGAAGPAQSSDWLRAGCSDSAEMRARAWRARERTLRHPAVLLPDHIPPAGKRQGPRPHNVPDATYPPRICRLRLCASARAYACVRPARSERILLARVRGKATGHSHLALDCGRSAYRQRRSRLRCTVRCKRRPRWRRKLSRSCSRRRGSPKASARPPARRSVA